MIFSKTEVWGFEHAIRGMRNPYDSWDKSDSGYKIDHSSIPGIEKFVIGENDLSLAQKLIKAGSEHRKFLRQIFVSVDITAPQYFFAELDTYKIGVTRNSTSMQHRGVSHRYTIDDFEVDEKIREVLSERENNYSENRELFEHCWYWEQMLMNLNVLRDKYLETKDYEYFRLIRQLMPMGYLYKSTITMNYENLLSMVKQRKNHKLTQWSVKFVEWVKTLPYANELIFVPLGEMEKMEDRTMKKEERWYYPEKGEMPVRQENGVSDHVIVAVEGCTYGMAGYYDFDMKVWFVDGSSEPVSVYAWKDVELPKSLHKIVG